MKPLHEISNKYLKVLDKMECEGEIGCNELDAIIDNFENKSISIASYIKSLEAELEMVSKAMDDLEDRWFSLDNKIEYFKKYLMQNMERIGIKEVKSSPYFCIKIKKCPQKIEVDEKLIPEEYKCIKNIIRIDNVKIKSDLNNGVVIPGVKFTQNNRIEIK